jgi:hypothetical protein
MALPRQAGHTNRHPGATLGHCGGAADAAARVTWCGGRPDSARALAAAPEVGGPTMATSVLYTRDLGYAAGNAVDHVCSSGSLVQNASTEQLSGAGEGVVVVAVVVCARMSVCVGARVCVRVRRVCVLVPAVGGGGGCVRP